MAKKKPVEPKKKKKNTFGRWHEPPQVNTMGSIPSFSPVPQQPVSK
jgi:hypothetical protein